jgi:hypothetical protein
LGILLNFDDGIEIEVILFLANSHTSPTVGSSAFYANNGLAAKSKRAIVEIKNTHNKMCMSRAGCMGEAHMEYQKWKNISSSNSQCKRAI